MTRRLIIFVLTATLLLPVGYIGAQLVWWRFHDRHDRPETGLYHGFVSMLFVGPDEHFFLLSVKSESSPQWYWSRPTNFSYTTFEVDWRDDSSEGHATVSVPEFTYRTDGASGVFTRDVVSGWLYGSTSGNVQTVQKVDAIFGYFEAAANGTLPPPRHHSWRFEEPVDARIQHFLAGYGFGTTHYIWLAVWGLLVIYYGRRYLRKNDTANKQSIDENVEQATPVRK